MTSVQTLISNIYLHTHTHLLTRQVRLDKVSGERVLGIVKFYRKVCLLFWDAHIQKRLRNWWWCIYMGGGAKWKIIAKCLLKPIKFISSTCKTIIHEWVKGPCNFSNNKGIYYETWLLCIIVICKFLKAHCHTYVWCAIHILLWTNMFIWGAFHHRHAC